MAGGAVEHPDRPHTEDAAMVEVKGTPYALVKQRLAVHYDLYRYNGYQWKRVWRVGSHDVKHSPHSSVDVAQNLAEHYERENESD